MIFKARQTRIIASDSGFCGNEQILNHITGQQIKIFKSISSKDALEMETTYPSFSEEPPMHFHPQQEEYFEVLEGELTIRFKGDVKQYEKGSFVHIKAKEVHAMWNSGFTPAKVSWKVTPALDTERLLKTTWQLANDGKTNESGRPTLVMLIFLLMKYRKTFRLMKPNFTLVTLLSLLMTPVFYIKKFASKY